MEIPIAENPGKTMKQIEEETLPEDVILLNILPHLPVKSALRRQLVSKQWRNFMKHPFYRRLQFSVTKNRNPSMFLILGKPELGKSILPKSIAVDRRAKTIGAGASKYALFSKSSGYAYGGLFFKSDVIWVCDGVFCVMRGADAALWNTAIREVRVFRGGRSGGNFKMLGTIGDFGNGSIFFVYSLNTNTCRVVESPSFRVNLIAKKRLVNVNGGLHLLAWGDYTKESAFLLTFDTVNETLGRIDKMPEKASAASVGQKDKGKGILVETILPSVNSSSGVNKWTETQSTSSANVGRFVRKSRDGTNSSADLDSQDGRDLAKTAALVSQYEYDDSFDDLGLSVGDSGLEENEGENDQNDSANKLPYLPDDIIFIILTRLPAKYVLRFRSVCKQWKTLISNPRFTRHHHLMAQRCNPITFLTAFPVDSMRLFSVVWIAIDGEEKSIRVDRDAYDLNLIREFMMCRPNMIGDACDGVFCVEHRDGAVLWNPATREVRVVKFNNRGCDLSLNLVRCVGFGSVKDERMNVVNFKLLFMVRNFKDSIEHFLVYSLRSNSFNMVAFPSDPRFLLRNISENGSVYLKGVLHWLAKGGEGAETAYILTFDLVSETFARIDLPHTDGINIHDMKRNFLTVLDNQYLSFGMATRCLNMWALYEIDGQRSWVRIEEIGPLMNDDLMVKYCDRTRGVITQDETDGRFWYHVEGTASKHDTELYGLTNWLEYSESLVSLKRVANGQLYNLEDIDELVRVFGEFGFF